MNETKPIESIEWTVATDEASQWVVKLETLWSSYNAYGWQFVVTLRDGINDLSSKTDKGTLYELVANQCNVSVKRLQNLVSMSRRDSSMMAMDLGLEIAHAENVLGLDDDEATSLLFVAAEQRWTPAQVSAEVRSRRDDVPVNGNQRSINDDVLDNNVHDVPFDNTTSNILYENADDYSAEADAYAGNAANYEYIDESDSYTYTGEEFAQRMIDAGNRLRRLAELQDGWHRQRTQREWIMKLEELIY